MKRRATVNGAHARSSTGTFLRRLADQLLGTALEQLTRKVSEGIEDIRIRIVTTLAGAGLMVTGLVFLVIAGVKGLESARLPMGLPEVIGGLLALGAGWLLVRRPAGR
jgi:hypothetical protein